MEWENNRFLILVKELIYTAVLLYFYTFSNLHMNKTVFNFLNFGRYSSFYSSAHRLRTLHYNVHLNTSLHCNSACARSSSEKYKVKETRV